MNQKKLHKLEEIITDLLVLSSQELLETLEDYEIPLEYKMNLAKKAREKGGEIFYYRFVLRTLITDYKFAREILNLDRDEELEAVHHLTKARTSSPQISFELGVWKALEENYAEAAYHFSELYKSLPPEFTPTGKSEKISTLTMPKLKGYLGIFEEGMDLEKDESYARELFHFSKELDGKRRIHREQTNPDIDIEQLTLNIDSIKAKAESKDPNEEFSKAKTYMKAAVFQNREYSELARKHFEGILSSFTESHLWIDCVYGCTVITPLEEPASEKYFDTIIELVSKFGVPRIKDWIYILAINISSPFMGTFLGKAKQLGLSEDYKFMVSLVETIIYLSAQTEPFSSDFLSDVYLEFLEQLECIEVKPLLKFVEAIQDSYLIKDLARWLFSAVRVLKFIHKERQTEADTIYSVTPKQYFELISFEEEFMVDIPTDVDYKM